MKIFNIYNSIDSYEKWGGGIGDIYVSLDDFAFPGKGWTDFGKNILVWWLDEFRKLHAGEAKKVQCKFMDGNYRFDVTVINSKTWKVEFIKERAESEEIQQVGEVNADQATETLLEATEKIIQLDEQEGNTKVVNNFAKYKMKFLSDWKSHN